MAESERPSRQDLVVPQRQSSFPLVLGSLLCAGIGFGLVMALGIGRSSTNVAATATADDTAPPTAAAVESAAPTQPGRFPDAERDGAPRTVHEPGWRPLPTPAPAAAGDERYPARPATLEAPADARQIEFEPRGASRFSEPGRFPGVGNERVRLAAAAEEAGGDLLPPEPESAAIGVAPVPPAGDPANLEPPLPTDEPPMQPQAADTSNGSDATAARPLTDGLAPAPPAADADGTGQSPPDSAVAATPPESAAAAPIGPEPPAGDLLPPPASRGFAPETSARVAPAFAGPPPAATPRVAGPPAQPDVVAAAAAPAVATAAANPFITAVPIGPPPAADRGPPGGVPAANAFAPGPSAGAGPVSPPSAGGSGQGRPGPMQLEGVQTPQLAVEKRGPREIQVGKPARYDIVVRNVGNATAHDVALRDAVPYGTTLVATTPPASPIGSSAAPAELLWPLGQLMPGGEARVSMEVMPQIEGELGSVASVSFRTDASARSRSTKPDLRLEATETKPVRIGGDIPLTLKVSNPGTGVATGVVIEGVLPDGVSHRAGRELEFDVGQLRPGESRTIDLVMTSTGPGVHQARFTARADGRLEVEQPVRVEITAPTLELTAEMPSRRYLQRPATCLLSMANAGTAPARSIELAAQLPPGMKFVRANHAGWYEERTHRVLWNLEELPPGEVGSVELVVMPVDLGPQKIVAAARSADGLSQQTAHTVEVEGVAALFFEVTDSEDPIEVGGVTEYIVRVGNQGTKAASGVRLAATLLGDLEPVDAKGPGAYRVDNLSFVFEPLAKLAPSEEAVYRVRVRGRREGDQRMQVQLASDDHPAPITKEEITRVYADR